MIGGSILLRTRLVPVAIVLLLASGAQGKSPPETELQMGERLVQVLDCNICHSPKVFTPQGPRPDATRLLSGHPAGVRLPAIPKGVIGPEAWGGLHDNNMTAWAGPWGVSFATNLTPDNETGIGVWTEEMFVNAIRKGKHMGVARPILPPMPWQAYSHLSDEELRAVFVYLKSLPPIKNEVPAPLPPTK
ncbi:MAG: diheme cytochrome c-553 [Candidatus Latescibacteria bacterium]|nr:diheme cytochrome c-553 [Candidatus Latescibacterota bacterium]